MASSTSVARKSKVFPVDAGDAGKRVWLVKVPEIVADIVESSHNAHADIGTFTCMDGGGAASVRGGVGGSSAASSSSSSSPAPGARKRTRVQLRVSLNAARVSEALGPDALGRTPLQFDLTLEDPIGARVFTRARGELDEEDHVDMGGVGVGVGVGVGGPGGPAPSRKKPALSMTAGFALSGLAAYSGALKPDVKDPAYSGYVAWRRTQDKAAQAQHRKSSLARPEDVSASQTRARQEAIALLQHGGPAVRDKASIVAVPRAGSVLEAFEKAPVWSTRQLMESTGRTEADVRADATKYCDYVRSGLHAGKYVLRGEYRTARTPAVPVQEGERKTHA